MPARSNSTGRAHPKATERVDAQRRKSTTERSVSLATGRDSPSMSSATRPVSMVRSPPDVSVAKTIELQRSNWSRLPTPTGSAASSRRSSVVLDGSAYRYSLNVGSISRFPLSAASGSGANTILAANAAGRERKQLSRSSTKETHPGTDPSRASVLSMGSSRCSSRLSSRYMAEEVAPQRRPVYLALPSDPAALGPWSSTGSTLVPPQQQQQKQKKQQKQQKGEKGKDKEAGVKNDKDARGRNSTTFPFPHPVTLRRRGDRGGNTDRSGSSSGAGSGLGAAWQRLLTAIFAGPYERQLNREEQEDDRITQSIIQEIAQSNSSHPHPTTNTIASTTSYGTLPIPKLASPRSEEEEDRSDPYGYRRLAGPHLLPSYTTDLVARRRERRRARSRARFQCMATWTLCTVSVLLVIILLVLTFSFLFPDRLDIPSHHDDGQDDDGGQSLRVKATRNLLHWTMNKVALQLMPNITTATSP
ncbi:uncharacterized protein UDID_03727 [Ustilago sp. UG-2017a]|nr:uncharacterized protein UDID_03727 [Ustilago sp. UG-2017a]